MLSRLVPAPLLSAALLGLWLVLARSVSIGHVLLGAGVALAVPHLTASLRPPKARLRRPLLAARYVLRVGADVVHHNVEVALGVVAWRWRRPQSMFVVIPLELHHPLGLAVLAMVTTVVPGTVWSELAADRGALLLHVWDVGGSEGDFIARYKARYEQPLREIFE